MILYFLYETNVWAKQNSFCTLGLVGTVDVCAHSCLTLCESMDYNPPGSFVQGILQARILGVGCHFLLQGILQGLNLPFLYLLHWQADSLSLSHQLPRTIGIRL